MKFILDEERFDEKARDQIERAARHLYGLIHARFVITTRGLAKMVSFVREKDRERKRENITANKYLQN
jgi:hypothetical protein